LHQVVTVAVTDAAVIGDTADETLTAVPAVLVIEGGFDVSDTAEDCQWIKSYEDAVGDSGGGSAEATESTLQTTSIITINPSIIILLF